MRSTSIAAGLALATVAFIAAVGGEPMWGGTGVSCQPTPRMSLAESAAIKRSMVPFSHSITEYELDHIIPLCLGGSNARSNLQLQDWPTARLKDYGPGGEAETCRRVHAGEMSCTEGRELMRTWGRR
jgi:hypothetical protein